MAENRIDSVIDIASVESEILKVEKQLAEMATTIKTFPKAQVFYDASGLKDLSSANKELSVVLSQLKVKNLELTNSIKEQQLAEKQLSVQRKQSIADAEKKAAAERELSRQQQAAGTERLRALRVQKEAEQELEQAAQRRKEAEGTFDIPQGSGQKGAAKLVSSNSVTQQSYIPSTDTERNLLFLTQTEAALKANQTAQKDLGLQLKNNEISQAEYNKRIVEARAAELEYKKDIQLTNAELKARTNIDFSPQGSIDAARAQNAILTQQRNAIPVGEGALPADIERVKQLNAEIDKNNELIDKNSDLLAKQKINIGNYPQALGVTFKTLNTELEQVQGKLVQGNFGGKEFDQLTAKQAVLQNALSLTGKTYKSSAAEATAYKEAAVQIGQVYGKDSSIFKQFAEGVKTGAANTKALANEVAGVATKGKGFVSFLSAAWSGIRKLAYAIPGLGIAGVILLLLGPLQAAGEALIKWRNNATDAGRASEDLKKRTENLNTVIKASVNEYGKAVESVTQLKEEIKLAKEGFLDKEEVLKHYNETIGKTTGQVNTLDAAEANLEKNGEAFIHLMLLKSEAVAAYAEAAKASQKAVTAQQDAESDFGGASLIAANRNNLSFLDKLKSIFLPLDPELLKHEMEAANATVNENAEKNKKDAEKNFEDFRKLGDKISEEAAKWAKEHGFNFFPTPDKDGAQKSFKDAERLLDEFRKKSLKEAQEYLKALDEAELKQYKLMADDQNLSLTERLDFEKKYYEKSLQMAKQNVQDQIDAVNLEASIATKKAGGIKDAKKKADTLTEIEDYRVTAIKRISEEGNAATLKIDRDFYNENVQIATQSYDKINKIAEESAKFRQDQEKIAFQNQKDQIDIDKNNQLLALDKAFKSGQIKNLEEYNQRKDDIETAAGIKQKQLDLKRIQDAERIIEAIYGVKNLNLIKQAKDLEVEIEEAGNKKIFEDRKRLNENLSELRDQLEQTFQDVIEGGFEARQQKNEAETKAIQDKSQKEIDAINASGLAEEEKTRRVTAIQKQADFQTQQIEKRQQQQDIARAKFERVMSIAKIVQNTAIAISKAIAESPLTFGMPWTAIDAALGAAQIASILAQPLPHFKEGTKNAPRGKAIVGEEGSELIVDKAGRMFVTPPQPTLIELAGGEQVFKHDITADFLKHHNLLSILQKAQSQKQPVKIDDDLARRTLRVLQNIERKQGITIINNVPIESTAYYNRNIKN